ncbi:hypothetical protein BLOT_015117 [Blomia tropicalis]|nr:hypothetical protein BLOT_015117 [Blomia tropicalis]
MGSCSENEDEVEFFYLDDSRDKSYEEESDSESSAEEFSSDSSDEEFVKQKGYNLRESTKNIARSIWIDKIEHDGFSSATSIEEILLDDDSISSLNTSEKSNENKNLSSSTSVKSNKVLTTTIAKIDNNFGKKGKKRRKRRRF